MYNQMILDKIAEERKKKGLSVYKLTELANLSANTIYNWYNKGASPTIAALSNVCNVLDLSLPILLSSTEKEYLSAQEETLIEEYRKLTDKQRQLIVDLIKELGI